jgi:hypothetical protein
MAAITEGAQEGFQQFLQNLIEHGVYNPEKDVSEEVGYNALIGAIVGGGAKPIIDKVSGYRGERRAPTAEEINDALGVVAPVTPTQSPATAAATAAPAVGTEPPPVAEVPPLPTTGVEPPSGTFTPDLPPVPKSGEFDELNPPPAEPPSRDEVSGPQRIDLGFGNELVKTSTGWEHREDGRVVSQADNFADISVKAKTYLDTGVVLPPGKPIATPSGAPTSVPPSDSITPYRPPEATYVAKTGAVFPANQAKQAAYNYLVNERKMTAAEIKARRMDYNDDVVQLANSFGWDLYKPADAVRRRVKVVKSANTRPAVPNQLPADVVQFVNQRKPKISATSEAPTQVDPNAPQEQTIEARPKANAGRLTDLLGTSLYGDLTDVADVTTKELFQNAYDSIRAMVDSGSEADGNIHITFNPENRQIVMLDDGSGMTPQLLGNEFLEIAGTHKTSDKSTGGFGIAKLVTLYANNGLKVLTMKDGVVSRMATTGPALKAAMSGDGPAPTIDYGPPTSKETALFPKGHGTVVQITVPESFVDPQTMETKEIDFPVSYYGIPALRYSPLLSNVNVHVNGVQVEGIGSTFPADEYRPLFDVKFPWGGARLYASRDVLPNENYGQNMHVLINGLWQFSMKMPKDLGRSYGDNIPRRFFLDMSPNVKAGKPGYPVAINRQDFSPAVKSDMASLVKQINAMFRFEMLRDDVTNYGQMSYVDAEGNRSRSFTIEPKTTVETPISTIQIGDKVVVRDGKMYVDGKELPEIDVKELNAVAPDFNTLKVEQSEIDPNKTILHDNVMVKISDVEEKSIIDLAVEKFGQRFIDFITAAGNEFRGIRDALISSPLHRQTGRWKGLEDIGIGISFDQKYRGVSTVIPFKAAYLNIAVPEFTSALHGGVGIAYTGIHELAHYNERNHAAGHSVEMQNILNALDTHPEYDFHAAKQRIVSNLAANEDIFRYINGFFSGTYTLSPRGKRFEDVGSYEARDGGGAVAGTQTGGFGQYVAGLDQPSGARAEASATGPFGPGSNRRVAEAGVADKLAEQRSNTRNLQQIDPDLTAEYPQSELGSIKQAVAAGAGGGSTGGGGGSPGTPSAAGRGGTSQLGIHADAMNKMMKWMWGLDRLVDKNKLFAPLLRYAERIREMRLDTSKWHDAGLRIVKSWRSLGRQSENLVALIDDVTNMSYRLPSEVQRGVVRHPTPQEFAKLVNKHKVSAAALDVYKRQKLFFETFLDEITALAHQTAQRTIQDPAALVKKIDEINARKDNLLSRPYFPFTRFGTHFVTVKDAAGRTKFFQTYERKGFASAERQQLAAYNRIKRAAATGDVVTHGVLPETAAPFVGLPPELLESIATELNLTPLQRDALDQLRYQYAPAASFSHHWQNKNYTPGYSKDFIRAFSRYAFHGGRYYSRVKYAWALRDEIAAARSVPGNKAGAIANYMEDHLQNTVLDAKGDFGLAKGAIFLWVFGYSPVGAFINLSQTPLITYPFLAAKFGGIVKGDLVASKAIARATTQLNNFYSRGRYDNQSAFELKAMDYGIKTGRISEAMASELAGAAQGENLYAFGNNKVQRGFMHFMEKAAWMFEMAEQFNRRIAFRAALDLAQKYPNSKAVKEALIKHADEFQALQTGRYSFNPAEAAAVVTAAYVTEQTQFTYARETRPRFMRGKLAGTLFVFKTYMLNVLQLLGANKSSVMPRYLLMMLLTSGLMGLPGADDMADLAQLLGKWMFGKDFNVKLALRKLILDLAKGEIPPDLVLHGFARKGFGLPAMMDLMGEHPGRGLGGAPDSSETRMNYLRYVAEMKAKQGIPGSYEEFRKQHSQNVPAPSFDMSRSLGMGNLLPIHLGDILDPRGGDAGGGISTGLQQASGAVFSVGFNLYKALHDQQQEAGDMKRWEKAMPRAAASLSRSYRAYSEGKERARGTGPDGSPIVVKYDSRDTEHALEILGMMGGFMPSRLSAQWDSIAAQQEVESKFKLEKQALFGQMFEAVAGRDEDEIGRVREKIIKYNRDLPDWAASQQITSDALSESVNQRARAKALKEAGLPLQRSQVPIARHVQDLFPESVVDVRPVN